MALKLIYLTFIITSVTTIYANYQEDRIQFIKNEATMAVGSNIRLTDKENVVNNILMTAKHNLKKQYPGTNFYQSPTIEEIKQSEVFNIIRRMPKGAALNLHDLSISSIDFLVLNITYRDNLYICATEDDIKFKFAESDPTEGCWKSVKMLREEERIVEDFDDWLRSKLSLDIDELHEKHVDDETVLKEVLKITAIIKSLVLYRPIFYDYIYSALEDFWTDNVMYVELYGFLPHLYELNGTIYNSLDSLRILKEVNDKFVRDHPDFIGFKYIYTPECNSTTKQNLKQFDDMKQIDPNIFGGFEISHKNEPLTSFIDQLFKISESTNFLFHSNDNELSSNIIDAILLNATRIGYSNKLFQHPLILNEIKQKRIAVEVCPSSFKDLQNHPVRYLLASGYLIVISSCNSYIWDKAGISFNYYEAFMEIANETADLKMLKQLFLNSLLYSSMTAEEISDALLRWENKWNLFIDDFVMDYNYVE